MKLENVKIGEVYKVKKEHRQNLKYITVREITECGCIMVEEGRELFFADEIKQLRGKDIFTW